ncbi:MAG: HlyD family efflux transporter periplasmic adaptor subunit [Bacteroidetes bacterium]|nr:HlyD family efflux transporter periplasmic adaptor subunit [Bacteroidota bacterium]
MKRIHTYILLVFIPLLSCNNDEEQVDAYGNFEAIEVMVSAETSGLILEFPFREGDRLKEGQVVASVDTIQLVLQREQLQSGKASLGARIKTLEAQVKASRVQLENLEREKKRIDKLVEGGAATSKQQDDIDGQIELLKAQIVATKSQKTSVYAERSTLEIQILQVDDRIRKSSLKSPGDGVILTKYKEKGELATPGQPLYKMANMDELILRAYISGNQLSSVNAGVSVTVQFDVAEGVEKTSGTVSWVSQRAEFTPKIIQTREERVNLVYAIKVLVPNDGSLKIGMPGEIIF